MFGFDPIVGYGLFALYAMVVWQLVNVFAKGYTNNAESFLLARRELNFASGAISIAAAWLWAPGLFVSAYQGYMNGLDGVFWFCLGNFLTLPFFAYFADKLRREHPGGFTMSETIRLTYGGSLFRFYQFEMLVLAVCAFAINLIAGGSTVAILTNIPYNIATGLMAFIALAYTFRAGLKATVVTEIVKISVVWVVVIALVAALTSGFGLLGDSDINYRGVANSLGEPMFGSFGLGVFTSFGIAAFLGHMAGPWRDNSFYQRAFAIKQGHVIPAFVLAGFIFILVPIAMGFVGMIGGASPEVILAAEGKENNINLITIGTLLPAGAALLFAVAVLAGLIGILDSQMASVTNIIGNDFSRVGSEIRNARIAMVVLAIIGYIVANIDGITIGNLFLFFSVMGTTLFIPTMFAIVKPKFFVGSHLLTALVVTFVIAMGLQLSGYTFQATLTALLLPVIGAKGLQWARSSS